jgi:hypothetical protein
MSPLDNDLGIVIGSNNKESGESRFKSKSNGFE